MIKENLKKIKNILYKINLIGNCLIKNDLFFYEFFNKNKINID